MTDTLYLLNYFNPLLTTYLHPHIYVYTCYSYILSSALFYELCLRFSYLLFIHICKIVVGGRLRFKDVIVKDCFTVIVVHMTNKAPTFKL